MGMMGYLGFDGCVELNIVIWMIMCVGGWVYFYVGGGVVWDFDLEVEYEEMLIKVKVMCVVLEMSIEDLVVWEKMEIGDGCL